MRWLLLDHIDEILKGSSARTSASMPAGQEVSPELLLLEIMAQTAGLVMGAEKDFSEDIVLGKIEASEFCSLPEPGALLAVEASAEHLRDDGAWFDCRIASAGNVVAKTRLMLMNIGHLKGDVGGSITFHEQFMRHFRVREFLKVNS